MTFLGIKHAYETYGTKFCEKNANSKGLMLQRNSSRLRQDFVCQ